MSQSLVKGEKVSLTKADPGLTSVRLASGWDVRKGEGEQFDLDLVVVAVGPDGKYPSEDWRVFFNNVTSPFSAILHSGDNLTGAGDGDDETVDVDLAALP